MEPLDGGAAARFCHHRNHPSAADRFLGIRHGRSDSSPAPPLELSEDDIFSTPSGSSSPSPTRRNQNSNPSPARSLGRNHYGILAALNGGLKAGSVSGSEYDTRPVFNRKPSALASLSSLSPSPTTSSKIMIPRPPPQPQADRGMVKSAPVNVPSMPKALQKKARELEDVLSEEEKEEEEEEDNTNGVIMPPHEVVAARHSPMLASSVLEGAGRTLKGRDLRQVRNAIWRKTGFMD